MHTRIPLVRHIQCQKSLIKGRLTIFSFKQQSMNSLKSFFAVNKRHYYQLGGNFAYLSLPRLNNIKNQSSICNKQHLTLLFSNSTISFTSPLLSSPVVKTRGIASLVEPVSQTTNASSSVIIPAYNGELIAHGLGVGWTSVVQNLLEMFTVLTGLPWYGSIALLATVMRVTMFPLTVSSQINAGKLNEVKPEIELLQKEVATKMQQGDHDAGMKARQKMNQFMKEKGVSPFKSLVPPLVQIPILMSFFFALRKMLTVPLPSMTTGGMLWFTDLSLCDPTYTLPLIACVSTLGAFEVSKRSSSSDLMEKMANPFRAMIVLSIGITSQFPAGILVYWIVSNWISLFQGILLRIPSIRSLFGMHSLQKQQEMTKSSMNSLNESMGKFLGSLPSRKSQSAAVIQSQAQRYAKSKTSKRK